MRSKSQLKRRNTSTMIATFRRTTISGNTNRSN